ncbi:uncharacterized protein KIAA1211-like isoform X2 [Anneissia japonica]|uniref:uncharacterized protein KIAA1211-like isoform X2 n=1 Tax=Anneissia japonica TaxID=1529436 RepID=UPI00142580A6|nr:uncharacterized protein KIAA1211-like isoform X2 [Anneissia japonica]
MWRLLGAVCPCGRRSFETSDRQGTDQKNPEARRLLTSQQSTSSFQNVTPEHRVPVMATAAISEGSFQEIEPLNSTRTADWEISGTSEPGPSSPTSPMSDAMRPTSPEGLMSDEEDMEGIDDPRKKKRFRPFKSIRKLFKKKRTSKSEDDIDGALRSKSTGELNLSDTDERMFDPRPSSTTMTSSRSESSVFVPEQTTPLREGESSKSTEHISKDFAKDLSAMLARRMSPDDKGAVRPPAEDDVDKATTEETMQEEEESLKEKSFNDTDKSMSAASPWAEKRTRYTRPSNSLGDTAYLDLDVIQTSPNSHLSHSAAKHKMSVKPKTRRATTRARISSQRNNPEPASHDASMNDSSFSNNLGDSSILSETTEESSTSSLLGNQQELPESLPPVDTPINEDTFSTIL